MGSSDFPSEAAINDDSEKCYLPAITQPWSTVTCQCLPWHFWLAFAPEDLYKLLCCDLHPFKCKYSCYLLINAMSQFFLNNPWLAVRVEAMWSKYFLVHLATLFWYLKTSLTMVHSSYFLYIKLNQLQGFFKKKFIWFYFLNPSP